jgi:hypothetical protein
LPTLQLVEQSDTHHRSAFAAKRWVSHALNPSYYVVALDIRARNNAKDERRRHDAKKAARGIFRQAAKSREETPKRAANI